MTETITAPADARSPLNEFEDALRAQGLLHKNSSTYGYAKDHHFRDHGFEFIRTGDDVLAFLAELDGATSRRKHSTACTKATVIRNALKKPSMCDWSEIDRFKIHAAAARRVHCACHQTGSFAPMT